MSRFNHLEKELLKSHRGVVDIRRMGQFLSHDLEELSQLGRRQGRQRQPNTIARLEQAFDAATCPHAAAIQDGDLIADVLDICQKMR